MLASLELSRGLTLSHAQMQLFGAEVVKVRASVCPARGPSNTFSGHMCWEKLLKLFFLLGRGPLTLAVASSVTYVLWEEL